MVVVIAVITVFALYPIFRIVTAIRIYNSIILHSFFEVVIAGHTAEVTIHHNSFIPPQLLVKRKPLFVKFLCAWGKLSSSKNILWKKKSDQNRYYQK